jgi:hypothetical protein
MSKPAHDHFLRFALGEAVWRTNFRDFGAAIRRMVTLGDGGRIGEADVDGELVRLRASWRSPDAPGAGADELARVLGATRAAALDRFDRVQLADVVAVCRTATSLSAAGRILFRRRGRTSAATTTPIACASTSRAGSSASTSSEDDRARAHWPSLPRAIANRASISAARTHAQGAILPRMVPGVAVDAPSFEPPYGRPMSARSGNEWARTSRASWSMVDCRRKR